MPHASISFHSDLLVPIVLGAALALTARRLLRRPQTRRFLLLLTGAIAIITATSHLVADRDIALLVSSVALAELARAIVAACSRHPQPATAGDAHVHLTVHPPTTATTLTITVLINR